ncbi:ABC transporter permease [Spiroplasma endosymbiont of Stenodema calcarata]|uniref:ABC transporter permease n=1 Tax=Spiroplasma endosymbiont of Stenodema calcarata TaxID=3139328 RepID=UPI003CCADAB0
MGIDFISLGNLGALPFSIFLFLIIAIITYIVTKFYKYGRYLYAVGGNENAALLSGIRVNLIKLSAYALSGLLTGVGMLLYLGRVGAISPADGNGWELNAIAAVVLGGTSLAGGKGGILNTIIGWLTLSILSNALILIDINPNV